MMTAFERIVRDHGMRYPLMQPQDYGKLAYQSALGPAHLVADEPAVTAWILREWQSVSTADVPRDPEPIGNGLCRFHMTAADFSPDAAVKLAKLLLQSAKACAGTPADLQARLDIVGRLPVDGMDAWLAAYRQSGCPPVRHSEAFRRAYHPHYRVILTALL